MALPGLLPLYYGASRAGSRTQGWDGGQLGSVLTSAAVLPGNWRQRFSVSVHQPVGQGHYPPQSRALIPAATKSCGRASVTTLPAALCWVSGWRLGRAGPNCFQLHGERGTWGSAGRQTAVFLAMGKVSLAEESAWFVLTCS